VAAPVVEGMETASDARRPSNRPKVSSPDLLIRFESADAQGNPVDDPNSPSFVKYVIPGRQYFEMEMLECGLVLVVAAAVTGAGLAAVKYRRPY
jgi:hypothetical protein